MKQPLNAMTLVALIGLASTPLFAGPLPAEVQALALDAVDARSILVDFDDLDPSLPADASTLVARLRLAARNACSRNDEARQIFLAADRKTCMAQSYASAVAQVNAARKLNLEAIAARHDTGRSRNLNASR